jgi:hypothetical protein
MFTIGFDVSTSITGIALFQGRELIDTISINTKNKKHFPTPIEVAFKIREELINLDLKPDQIIIEESLQGFARGKSSAGTIITLSQINALVRFITEDLYNIKPIKISAKKARKAVGIDIPKGVKGKDLKKLVLLEIDSRIDRFAFEYTIHGNPREEAYDRADAVVIALSHIPDD